MTKIASVFSLIVSTMLIVNCGGGGFSAPATPPPVSIGSSEPYSAVAAASNVVSLSIGSSCAISGAAAYQNEICASVTVCNASASCVTIDKVLVDTGSYGLRLFKTSGLTGLSLPAVAAPNGDPLYNCVTYLDGAGQWGPVKSAKVQLGNMTTASAIPIEIIDSTDQTPAGDCAQGQANSPTLDTDAVSAGFNGIIGVGLFKEDCGTGCATGTYNGVYFACDTGTSTCVNSSAPLASQVTNPVSAMSTGYNNGLVMNINTPSGNGSTSITGQMILGIGSVTNNTPTTSSQLTASSQSKFTTIYNGVTYTNSFIDSGSNGLYFHGTNIALCTDGEFYCPGSAVNLSATMIGRNNYSRAVAFQINNTVTLLNANSGNNRAFSNLGGLDTTSSSRSDQYFDWGLPIFMGRRIYFGLDSQTATFTQNGSTVSWTGPYWAL